MLYKEISEIRSQVLSSYTKLGYTPRGTQEDICVDVLDKFINRGCVNIILDAPTGVGKSVLGAVIADALDALTPVNTEKGAIISMGTNMLGTQYYESFSDVGDYDVFQIQGSSNYPCSYLSSLGGVDSPKTGDDCVIKSLGETEKSLFCSDCAYNKAKKMVNTTNILITNYSYFFVAFLASGHLKPRKLHVFDEAHTLNDIFCNYAEIVVSCDSLDKYIKELNAVNGKCESEAAALVVLKKRLENKEIGSSNYKEILTVLASIYASAAKTLNAQSTELERIDIIDSARYGKMARKYARFATNIKDLFKYKYDHVFDDSVPNTFSIKTIFIADMMKTLTSTYNLFMSATITESFVYDTLQLDPKETAFVSVPPVFPPANKPVFFIGNVSLNYNTLKDQSVIAGIKSNIKTIVDFHKDEKGLIIVPSFALGTQLASAVGKGTKVFEHKSGIKLSDMVAEFKKYKGSALLISPSIFEGVDFKDDYARFNIIIKAPYPSLGDKRIKYICDNYPEIYQEMTLLKIIQGAGRAVRSPTDSAATYFVDTSIKKLFNSKMNIWKPQFTVMTK